MNCNVRPDWLPPGTKESDFIHHDNVVIANGKPVHAFEQVPVRLLKAFVFKDRGRKTKYAVGQECLVHHLPDETEWHVVVGGTVFMHHKENVIEHVDFEFI